MSSDKQIAYVPLMAYCDVTRAPRRTPAPCSTGARLWTPGVETVKMSRWDSVVSRYLHEPAGEPPSAETPTCSGQPPRRRGPRDRNCRTDVRPGGATQNRGQRHGDSKGIHTAGGRCPISRCRAVSTTE